MPKKKKKRNLITKRAAGGAGMIGMGRTDLGVAVRQAQPGKKPSPEVIKKRNEVTSTKNRLESATNAGFRSRAIQAKRRFKGKDQ